MIEEMSDSDFRSSLIQRSADPRYRFHKAIGALGQSVFNQ